MLHERNIVEEWLVDSKIFWAATFFASMLYASQADWPVTRAAIGTALYLFGMTLVNVFAQRHRRITKAAADAVRRSDADGA